MSDKGSVDYLAGAIAQLEAQRAKIDSAIETLKALLAGSPIPTGGDTSEKTSQSESVSPESTIELDTFHGLTVAQSVKKYLGMRKKKPASTQEVVDALRAGGQSGSDGANFGVVVTNSLNRMSADDGEVSKVRRGVWGLKSWYGPNGKTKD
jgi:hypothetical protein